MSARLVAYVHVPLGFEMVIEKTEGRIWNLWYNVQLTDDPENWDNEVKSINRTQEKLGELDVDHRLIRAQMAEFCRVHPLFPQSVDVLCREIGEGCFSDPVEVGCEGRGLLYSLGYHTPEGLKEQQKEIFRSYSKSLEKWVEQVQPKSSVDSKVSGFLGKRTDSKVERVKSFIQAISASEPSLSSVQNLVEDACKRKNSDLLTKARANYLGRPFNCFKCGETDKCKCCYPMFVDAGLLCIGISGEDRSVFDEFRHFIEENILAYSMAINSWLEGVPSRDVMSIATSSYVTKDNALEIATAVHSALGEKDQVKTWLAACLLKTIKSNKRWHKTTELIDSFPEATSWLEKCKDSR